MIDKEFIDITAYSNGTVRRGKRTEQCANFRSFAFPRSWRQRLEKVTSEDNKVRGKLLYPLKDLLFIFPNLRALNVGYVQDAERVMSFARLYRDPLHLEPVRLDVGCIDADREEADRCREEEDGCPKHAAFVRIAVPIRHPAHSSATEDCGQEQCVEVIDHPDGGEGRDDEHERQ